MAIVIAVSFARCHPTIALGVVGVNVFGKSVPLSASVASYSGLLWRGSGISMRQKLNSLPARISRCG